MGLWFDLLKEYSLRRLSFESDRLNAISALAERLSRMLQDEYIGGIWKKDLPTCLQWSHSYEDGHLHATRQRACGAPTWSWASVGYSPESQGGVVVDSVYTTGEGAPLVRLVDLQWQPKSDRNKFGDLSKARITLSGRLLRGYAYPRKGGPDVWKEMVTMTEELDELPREKIKHHPDYNSEGYKRYAATFGDRWWLHVCGKRLGQRARLIMMMFPDTGDCVEEGFLYLLPLADYSAPGQADSTLLDRQSGRLFGLVLKELKDGTFERVGCIRVFAKYLMTAKERSIVLV